MSNGHDHVLPRELIAALPYLVFACDGAGGRSWSGARWGAYTGLSDAASLGLGWLDAIHPDDRRASLQAWSPAPAAGRSCVEHRIRRAADGAYRWHRTVATAADGGRGWIGGSDDLDELHLRLLRSNEESERLRGFVEGVPQLLWRSSDLGDWRWTSPQWLDFTGQTQAQSHGRGWLGALHPDDRAGAFAAWEEARPHGRLDATFRVRRQLDGAHLWHRTRALPVHDAAGGIVEWLGSTTDVHDLRQLQERQRELLTEAAQHARALEAEVRERQRAEARLLFEAHHDALTGLHSRACLIVRLQEARDRSGAGPGRGCAVLRLDLDRFTVINKSLGHEAGDALLVEVARRLRACVRHRDAMLARLDSDEFAIVLRGDLRAAAELAEQVVASVRTPFELMGQAVFSSCRLGLAHVADGGGSPEGMLRDADIAMQRARDGGPGDSRCVVFTEAMRGEALEAFTLRTELRQALARAEFRVHYQPICDAGSRRILGLEALVRWQHPRLGLVPPDAFVRIAEETGLIRELDGWVLDQACRQMRSWREQFPRLELYLNVNSSGSELMHPCYTDDVLETLDRTGLDPHLLQLEVTETVFLRYPERIGRILERIRRTGVRVALDDFGTGYSSLGYLDRYRVDTIKIDRSFVSGLQVRRSAAAIVQTIVRLGHDMGLAVVAEGVEDEVQLQAVWAAGCGIVQGFLLGRPVAAEDATAVLAMQHEAMPGERTGVISGAMARGFAP